MNFHPVQGALPEYVNFVIVGGGFTGLAAAAWLRRLAPKKSVLVIESATLGEGASGRTGGLALADTAAGPLRGLGNVLLGYKNILRALRVDSGLELRGVWELGRSNTRKNSPIFWNDSGDLKVVRRVAGSVVDPGKVVAGLARAAQEAGAQIIEHTRVDAIGFSNPLQLRVECRTRGRIERKEIRAGRILLATNAYSAELSGLARNIAPRLTLALATAPLSRAQLRAIGLSSRRPFYTVDLPYLWGRLLESNGVIFGAGLVPIPKSFEALFRDSHRGRSRKHAAFRLYNLDVRKGESADRLRWLEDRVRHLHPALRSVRITHRWGGPILFTEGMRPIFRRHPRSKNAIVLGGYNGHGVALSVYLGKWAAEALLARRALPAWGRGN
ncbi:MAG TPA: FAD-binding oxidoreductase [Candidatus Angelobacter sp.]|nr:FAD-binding oxidoreductase [Candidatus Angelobacter sp.]